MYSGGRHSAGFAATLFALLFAVTLRGLVPAGYMPEAGADGVHLVICGPSSPAGHDDGSDDPQPAGSGPVCVFAAAAPVAGPADPPPLPRPPVLALVHDSRPALRRDAPAADRSEGPPPPARAPPLSI